MTSPPTRDPIETLSARRLEVLGLLVEEGDWRSRTYQLSQAGEATVLAMLRHTATGPRTRI